MNRETRRKNKILHPKGERFTALFQREMDEKRIFIEDPDIDTKNIVDELMAKKYGNNVVPEGT